MGKRIKTEQKAKHLAEKFEIVLAGALTGMFAGVAVTLYTLLAKLAEEFSRGYYGFFRTHPAFIPLLFLALFLGAVVIGGTLRFLPLIRGSGIPQTEGEIRGLMRFRWYRALTGMFAASLFTVFMGLSAGAEGPSVMIGGACGSGVSVLLKRGARVRRYAVTGGASAGLAVAFNAPLTGMVFAFEEGQRRFTPEVVLCAVSSVPFAVGVRALLYMAFGLENGAYFSAFSFAGADMLDARFYGYLLLTVTVCALLGVALYHAVFALRRLFSKITFWKGVGKMLLPFLLAGGAGLLTAYAMGGGHGFISALGGNASGMVPLFSSPVWVAVLAAVLLRFFLTAVNMGAGVPCGAFIPMLSIGAGTGALMSFLCGAMGMPAAYADVLVVVGMAAFFTAVVKAPLTGVVMTFELTWDFFFLLPALIGVAVGYLAGELFRTRPVYDRLLEELLSARGEGVLLPEIAESPRKTPFGK